MVFIIDIIIFPSYFGISIQTRDIIRRRSPVSHHYTRTHNLLDLSNNQTKKKKKCSIIIYVFTFFFDFYSITIY